MGYFDKMAGLDVIASPSSGSLIFQSVGLFVLVFVVILKLLQSPKKSLPPGPKGWPILGNIPAFRRESSRHFHEILADWAQQYGNIMTVNISLGQGKTVVLSDLHAVKEALLKQPEVFSDRSVTAIRSKLYGGVTGKSGRQKSPGSIEHCLWKEHFDFEANVIRLLYS